MNKNNFLLIFLLATCGYLYAGTFMVASRVNSEIYRYNVTENGAATLDLTFQDPSFAIASGLSQHKNGELFVSDVTGNRIVRVADPGGNPTVTGSINSGGPVAFSNPAGVAFRDDNFFVANFSRGEILRFDVDNAGGTSFGAATTGLSTNLRFIEMSPDGKELFASFCCGTNAIQRFSIDDNGNLTPNGTISGNGLSNPHDMVFSPWGEIFVANTGNSSVSRFNFDSNGNAISNGTIAGNGITGAIGLDFSPWQELFVSSHDGANISRFTFDNSFNASANGFFTTPSVMAGLVFLEDPQAIPEPSSYFLLLVSVGLLIRVHRGR